MSAGAKSSASESRLMSSTLGVVLAKESVTSGHSISSAIQRAMASGIGIVSLSGASAANLPHCRYFLAFSFWRAICCLHSSYRDLESRAKVTHSFIHFISYG